MPTTKTISHIGDTKFELVKDTDHDAFRFTVDDRSVTPNSPKTVMYISSEPTTFDAPTPLSTSGRVTMSNIRTEGATSTSSADVDGDIGIGGKILIREGTGGDSATRAAIYAEKDPSAGLNHRLIIDPYQDDSNAADGVNNNGTVYIRGSLIVEGDKTILDTAEHITSENLLGINAIKVLEADGITEIIRGGLETTAGIHVYSGSSGSAQFLYNFGTDRWRTSATDQTLNDLEAKDLYAAGIEVTGTAELTTVDINGGNIDGTAIGTSVTSSGKFTTINASATIVSVGEISAPQFNGAVSGNAATATILASARTIGGVSFDGSTDIDLPGVNVSGTMDTTGNAATATILASARTIGGVSFDGSTDIDFASTNLTARDVNAVTFGNIVQVDLGDGGAREDVKTVTTNRTAPLHADISHHFSDKTFAAGQCVVALTGGSEASVAMFSFSKCGSTIVLVLDQEVHSNAAVLNVDYDSTNSNIGLNLGTATEAKYCVKVLPIMTSDSIDGTF